MYYPAKRRLPRYGDVIGVNRGLYQHYGVYADKDSVIEYASSSGDFGGDIRVQEVTLEKFLDGQSDFFILDFPDMEKPAGLAILPDKMDLVGVFNQVRRAVKGERYHLYTPEETVQRARSRLGEDAYNLALSNCEHFAIWCKTGISESRQVNRVLRLLEGALAAGVAGYVARGRKKRPEA